jgi:hypothetical protein
VERRSFFTLGQLPAARSELIAVSLRSLLPVANRRGRPVLAAVVISSATVMANLIAPSPAMAADATVACGDVAGLRAAIVAANTRPSAVINLALRCRYSIDTADNDETALPVVSSSLVVNGSGAQIVRSAGAPAFRLWRIAATGTLTLDSLTVGGGAASVGGGLFNDHGTLTLRDSDVTGNTATLGGDAGGGGIYSTGTLELVTTRVHDNSAVSSTDVAPGGGIDTEGTAELRASRVDHNTTTSSVDSAIGSGISSGFGGTVTLDATLVDHNSASSPTFAGGAGIANVGTLMLNSSRVAGNTAASPRTATAALENVGVLTLNHSQVYGNTSTGAGVPGAGIYTGGQATLRQSQVLANTARNTDPTAAAVGAGVFAAGGSAALIGTLVSGNRAVGPNAQAGGIFELGTAQVTLTDSVVVANVPDNCGPPGAIPGCPD